MIILYGGYFLWIFPGILFGVQHIVHVMWNIFIFPDLQRIALQELNHVVDSIESHIVLTLIRLQVFHELGHHHTTVFIGAHQIDKFQSQIIHSDFDDLTFVSIDEELL